MIFLFSACTQNAKNEQPEVTYTQNAEEGQLETDYTQNTEDERFETNYEYLLKNLKNPIIVEENQYYRLYRDENFMWLYVIFDKDGNEVKSNQYSRYPHIAVLDNKIISVSVQAGTGIETRWIYFYDVENGVLSDVFYSVFEQYDNRIIKGTHNSIIVRDIFDETKFFKEFEDFEGMSQNTAFPFVDAEFVDNGQKISVIYMGESYEKITVTFDLI